MTKKTEAEAKAQIQARLNTLSLATLQEMAARLFHNHADGASLVFSLTLDACAKHMEAAAFVTWCDALGETPAPGATLLH